MNSVATNVTSSKKQGDRSYNCETKDKTDKDEKKEAVAKGTVRTLPASFRHDTQEGEKHRKVQADEMMADEMTAGRVEDKEAKDAKEGKDKKDKKRCKQEEAEGGEGTEEKGSKKKDETKTPIKPAKKPRKSRVNYY